MHIEGNIAVRWGGRYSCLIYGTWLGKWLELSETQYYQSFLNNNKTAIGSTEKAELLAETLVKIHRIYQLDLAFRLPELRKAFLNVRRSSPGKDGIRHSMLAHMGDGARGVVLRLFKHSLTHREHWNSQL